MKRSHMSASFRRGVAVLAAVALMCVLSSLTACTDRGSSGPINGASTKAAPRPASLTDADHGDSDEGGVKSKTATLAAAGLPVAARADPATTAAALAVTKIPLVKGLTVIGAASERQGDYEASTTVDSIEPDGSLHLSTSADVPDPSGGQPRAVSVTRRVSASDLKNGRTYKMHVLHRRGRGVSRNDGDGDVRGRPPGPSLARRSLQSSSTGKQGGIAGMMSVFLGMMPGSDSKGASKGYLTASGILKLAEPKPVPLRVIVNNAPVSLPTWHVKGRFGEGDEAVDVEWYILDDPDNPLSLRFAFGKEQLEIVRIEFPVENEAKTLEAGLTENKRAVLYGIYFDFNSATIRPQSEAALRTIVDVMKKNPEWVLVVEGHTDNIGGDARNQDLSSRRAASVKAALVERGVSADRLNTAGYGASVPRETNATLAGRARNRRVELTRQ